MIQTRGIIYNDVKHLGLKLVYLALEQEVSFTKIIGMYNDKEVAVKMFLEIMPIIENTGFKNGVYELIEIEGIDTHSLNLTPLGGHKFVYIKGEKYNK